MALTPGTRLGVYEVTVQIGEGGMGAVYRATDTSLDRQVAIKVLPDAFAGDADRLVRFEREAKTLATLNHPHIATIYAIDKSAGVTALVMELVEGEDLSHRIAQGPMPLEEALPIAKQIAEALEAAHEHGIVHRDLKPANIKVRADGTVKVLDFGLAKAVEYAGAGASGSASISPTITSPAMTQAGVILGTAAYMSPEQARGRPVDRRADIWAFGAVLYEMLTGRRAFPGEDVTDTIVSVISKEPDFDALPATVPARVRQALRVCLRKDAKQRAGDIRDVRLALDGAFETAAPPPVTVPAPAKGGRLAWMAVAGAVATAAALAIPALQHLRETVPPVPPETRTEIVTPATTRPESFALSPDGRQIVFVASDDKTSRLWLRPLSTTTAQPLAGTDGASYPFWSPDGRSLGFFAGGALKRLDVSGGTPQVLAPATNGWGGTWNANGVIVFAPSAVGPLMRVAATGGAAAALTTLSPQHASHRLPQFLLDGQQLLFIVVGTADTAGLYLGALDGRAATQLSSTPSPFIRFAYAPPGFLLWVREGALVAQKLDVDRPALVGEPVTLASGIGAVSVSATGMVAYRTAAVAARQLTWFDRSGTARGVVGDPDGTLIGARVSPDGRRVAVARSAQDNLDIWLLDGPRTSRLTFDPSVDMLPVWSPDGAHIAYTSTRTGKVLSLFQTVTSGAGVDEPFLQTDQSLVPSSWSADGKFLLYSSSDPKTGSTLWVLPTSGTTGDRKPSVFLRRPPFRAASGEFSPDGRWVAYHSNETGRREVYVRPFVSPGAAGADATPAERQWQISTAGGVFPTWRADGKELYYLNPDGALMAVPITITGATLEPGAAAMLFPTRIYGGGEDIQYGRQYDVTRDGRFLINTVLNEAAAPITLLQNWDPEAKR